MTDKTQPTAHAEITAPISADLRGMPGLNEQDAELLEQAASMLEGLQNDERNRGNCSTAEGAGCSAHAVRRLAVQLLRAAPPAPAAVAVPELRLTDEQIEQAFISARDEFMLREIGRTDKKLRLAFGRAILKAALAAAPAQALAAPDLDMDRVLSIADVHAEESREDGTRLLDRGGLVAFAKDVLRVAAPAQEHATQLAGQGQNCSVCGSDEAFTGTCGGGRKNPRALCFEPAAPAAPAVDAREVETEVVGAMHRVAKGAKFSECVECGAMAEQLAKPCPTYMKEATATFAAIAAQAKGERNA